MSARNSNDRVQGPGFRVQGKGFERGNFETKYLPRAQNSKGIAEKREDTAFDLGLCRFILF
jgi:hypothetical protein